MVGKKFRAVRSAFVVGSVLALTTGLTSVATAVPAPTSSSNVGAVTASTPPSAPRSLTTTVGNSQVRVAWSIPSSAGTSPITGYRVYSAQSSTGPWQFSGTTTASTRNRIVTGLTNGTPYWFRVTAVNNSGEGAPGTTARATIPSAPPSAPTNLDTTSASDRVTLTWSPPLENGGSNVTSYAVQRALSASGPWTTAISRTTTTTATVSGLLGGTQYHFRVTATNSGGTGPAVTGSVTTLPAGEPGVPTNVKATRGSGQVTVAWRAPVSTGGAAITGYRVSYGTSPAGPWTLFATTTRVSQIVTGLTNGTPYWFQVTAVNNVGESPAGVTLASVTPSTVPTAARNIQFTPGSNQMSISWSAPLNDGGSPVTGYDIARATSSSGPWTNVASRVANTNVVATGLIAGTTYWFRVIARNANGASPALLGAQQTNGAGVTSAPQNVRITGITSTQATVAWSAPANNGGSTITGYVVSYSTSTGGPWTIAAAGVAGLQTSITGLSGGTLYYFRVVAVNGAGQSPAGTTSATTSGASRPGAPSTVLVLGMTNTTLDASWTPPLNNGGAEITGYKVYYSTSTAGPWTLSAGDVAETEHTIERLRASRQYFIRVTAVNEAGEGPASTTVGTTDVAIPPTTPLDLQAVPVSGRVILTWDRPEDDGGGDITGYSIFQVTDDPSDESPWSLVATGIRATGYTVVGLNNGTEYWFKVTATNVAGEGPAAVTTEGATPVRLAPSEPRNLKATEGSAQVTLSWTQPEFNGNLAVTSYNVYRSLTEDGPWVLAASNVSGFTRTITGLTNGTPYWFQVTAVNSAGEGDPAVTEEVVPAGPPSPPRNLTAVRGEGELLLSWEQPLNNGGSEVLGYKVYQSTSASGPWAIAVSEVDATSTSITGLENGVGYWFRVTAYNRGGEGLPVTSTSASTPATTPGAPRSVATSRGNQLVNLTWVSPVSNGGATITGYTVYVGESETGPWTVAASGISGTSRTVTGLTNGTPYWFQVTARNVIGEGEPGETTTATIPAAPTTAPQSVTATRGNAQVTVSWEAPSNDNGSAINGYTIFRATSSSGPWTTAALAAADATSQVVTGLTNGTRYWFRVTASNGAGQSAGGVTSTSTTPATVPSAPRNPTGIASDGQATISWTSPTSTGGSAITGYNVYQSTSANGPWDLAVEDVGTTSTAVTELENGVTYWFYITANNDVGEGLPSANLSIATAAAPPAPQELVALPGNTQVVLSWTPPVTNGGGAITAYSVYRATASTGPWTKVGTDSLTTSRTVTGLANGTPYWFQVTARSWAGEGDPITTNSAVVPATIPGAPTAFAAVAGNGQVSLSWNAPTNNGGAEVTAYSVSFAPSSLGPWTKVGLDTNATTRTVTELTNGTSYWFRVNAINSAGVGPVATTSAVPAVAPNAPVSVNATAGDSQATVTWGTPSWNGGSTITGYSVYYSASATGPWTKFGTDSLTTSRTVTGLENGTEYWFRVTASNSMGEGVPGTTDSSTTPASLPSAPRSLATVDGDSEVVLTWLTPASSGGATITAYSVYYSTSATGPWTKFGTDSLALTRTVTDLENGTAYWFRVTASNAGGEGADIITESSTTPATTPSAPRSFTATDGAGQVILNWTAPADNGGATVSSYTVSYATSSTGPWTTHAAGITGTSSTVTGLDNGTQYWFRVTASNRVGSGSIATTTGTPVSVPDAPSGLTATPGNSQVGLSWNAPSDTGGDIVTYAVSYSSTGSTGPWTTAATGLSGTTRIVTGLENGTQYWFRVSTSNRSGETVNTVPVAATPATVPGTPRNLATTAGTGQVSLTWSAPTSNGGAAITAYSVYFSTSATGPWTKFGTDSLTTSRTVTGLANGTPYWFRVTATNTMGEGAVTNSISSTTPATVPGPPRNLATTAGTGQVSLTWSAPTSNGGAAITAYSVYFSTSATGPWTKFGTDSLATSRTVTGLANGTPYWFRVTATNWAGEGGVADSANSVTPATTPSAPQNITTSGSSGQISVSWTPPANNGGATVTGYSVYYSVNPAGPWTLSATGIAGTSHTITGLVNGNSYWVQVTATNWAGEGAAAMTTTPTATITVPGAISGITPTLGNGQVSLSWTAPANDGGSPITDYIVEFGNSSTGPWTVFADGTSATTSATVTGLANGTAYWFRITPVNLAGNGTATVTSASSTPATVPTAPQSLTTNLGGAAGNIAVSWSAPSSNGGAAITFYNVYSGTGSTGPWTLCLATSLTSVNCTGLTDGTPYWFRVTANNWAGEGAAVVTSSSITPIAAPNAAGSVAATSTAVGVGSISVTWTRNATTARPISGGTVRACTNTAMTTGCLTPVSVAGTATSASLDNAVQNTLYYVRVDLNNTSGTTVSSTPSVQTAYNATLNSAFWSCSVGGSTLSGSTCGYTATYNPPYSYCSIGNSIQSGSSCGYPAASTLTCNSGYSLWGSTCYRAATPMYLCPSPSNAVQASTSCSYTTTSGTTTYGTTCPGTMVRNTSVGCSASNACRSFTCPSGGTLSGTTCLKTCSETRNIGVNKICGNITNADCAAALGSGWVRVGCSGNVNPRTVTCQRSFSCNYAASVGSTSTCVVTGTTYTCAAGWSGGGLNNQTCTTTTNTIHSYSCSSFPGTTLGTVAGLSNQCSYTTSTVSYSCPSGGTYNSTWNGYSHRCVYNATNVAASYSCPSGGTYNSTWNGSSNQCTYAATNNPSYYSCPSGGTVSGTICRF